MRPPDVGEAIEVKGKGAAGFHLYIHPIPPSWLAVRNANRQRIKAKAFLIQKMTEQVYEEATQTKEAVRFHVTFV